MKLLPRKTGAFSLLELLVVILIVGVLAIVAWPNVDVDLTRAKYTETLANARSLQQATEMMTLDSQQSGNGIQCTMWVSKGKATPISLATFLDAIVRNGYMTKSDLRKILSAPGKDLRNGEPNAGNIAFKIYQVAPDSPQDQVLLTTANVTPSAGMQADTDPYGNKGFVYFTKGGGGGIRTRQADATSTDTFPTGKGANGVPYRYIALE